MKYINKVQTVTHEWRMEKWPELTPLGQLFGTVIEIAELGEMLWKARHYDEDWQNRQRIKEEAGDVLIYFLGVLSLLDLEPDECIEAAMAKNDARDWEDHMEAPADD